MASVHRLRAILLHHFPFKTRHYYIFTIKVYTWIKMTPIKFWLGSWMLSLFQFHMWLICHNYRLLSLRSREIITLIASVCPSVYHYQSRVFVCVSFIDGCMQIIERMRSIGFLLTKVGFWVLGIKTDVVLCHKHWPGHQIPENFTAYNWPKVFEC